MKMKNLMKRGLVGALALTMLLGNTVLTQAARTILVEVPIVIEHNKYEINFEYVLYNNTTKKREDFVPADDQNAPKSVVHKVSGSRYNMTAPTLSDKVYAGYEVKDKNGNRIKEFKRDSQNPFIQTDVKATDVNYNGIDYTITLIYEENANNNVTPDTDESYTVFEHYYDQATGVQLAASSEKTVEEEVQYLYDNTDDLDSLVKGYKYVGYEYEAIGGYYAAGDSGSKMDRSIPEFILKSDSNYGEYDVDLYFEIDESQWITISYDPGDGTGEAITEKVLKEDIFTIKDNPGFTNGDLEFIGWSILDDNTFGDDDESYQPGYSAMSDKDMTLYAIWE
jgi:hypothetical protein